ncbi:Hypothetical predicted protein [Paramuricea clavata]|uniref:Uncharacterized protein n=1 Tax=Paramuricea clavata TaxID=317549 RepID=A0A6S7G6C9_PARCT|nr:Hypothetical predicted protein [Paramuricea clavata]
MALLHLQLLLLFGCFLQTSTLQPARAEVQYEDHTDPFPAEDRIDCEDRMKDARRCVFEKARRGCRSQLMQTFCAKTCHFCHKKAPAPPKVVDCKETTYGCCWDGESTQKSYDGEGCPPCEDNRIFAALCGIWEKHCHNTSNPIEHNLVKQQCHRTCNNCFIPKSTEQTKVTKTLPPAIGHFANSDDSPRRGAIYVWTKLVNPFATYDRQ